MSIETWKDLAILAVKNCSERKLGQEYKSRLAFEIKEINKQGANNYWVRLYNSGTKFDHNKNGLVFPFLLEITDVDPVKHTRTHIPCPHGEEGELGDIVEITADGKTINLSAKAFVLTDRGKVRVKDLQLGDELL